MSKKKSFKNNELPNAEQEDKRKQNLDAVILHKQNMNFADAINKIPAEKIKDELTIRLRIYKREGGTQAEFFERYQYKKLSVFLHLDIHQKDAYNLFFEGLIDPPAIVKLEKEFDELNVKFKKKFGIDIPIGGYIFEDYKKQGDKIESVAERIIYYKKYLFYWNKLALTDAEMITETEVTQRLIPLLKNEIELLELKTPIQPPAVTKMQAPVIALFCNSINESELIKKGESESVEAYCKRICKNYNLVYTQRVRQNFNNRATPKNLLKLKELILPAIDKETNNRIIEYLDKKDKSKHNLYA